MSVIAMPLTTLDVSNGKYYAMEPQGNARVLGTMEVGPEGLDGTATGPKSTILMDSTSLDYNDNGTRVSVPTVADRKLNDAPGDEVHEFPDIMDELLYDEILPWEGCGEVSCEYTTLL